MKPAWREVHDARPGEGLGEEDHVGVFFLSLGDTPLPEGKGLGMGVVDAEDANAAGGSRRVKTIAERFPEAAPVGDSKSSG